MCICSANSLETLLSKTAKAINYDDFNESIKCILKTLWFMGVVKLYTYICLEIMN